MTVESPATFNQASSYAAEQVRRSVLAWCARTAANAPGIITGGLLSATDCQLSAPVSGLSVNISTGEAIVGGSEGGTQGGYGPVRVSSTTNLTISTANPSLPRIDTITLTIADSGYTEPAGVSGNAAVPQVVVGTATSGATLANLTGKAALPASSLLLGYCLVPAAAANIITADIANVATPVVPASIASVAAARNNPGVLAAPSGTMVPQTRVTNTAYQPSTIRPTLVIVTTGGVGAAEVGIRMDAANPPTTVIGILAGGTASLVTCTFIVPPSFFYLFHADTGSPTITSTFEYTL